MNLDANAMPSRFSALIRKSCRFQGMLFKGKPAIFSGFSEKIAG